MREAGFYWVKPPDGAVKRDWIIAEWYTANNKSIWYLAGDNTLWNDNDFEEIDERRIIRQENPLGFIEPPEYEIRKTENGVEFIPKANFEIVTIPSPYEGKTTQIIPFTHCGDSDNWKQLTDEDLNLENNE